MRERFGQPDRMTDSKRPPGLVTKADLLARFWTEALIADVLGKFDWPSQPLLYMLRGAPHGLPGWHPDRVAAAESTEKVARHRAARHYWVVPPESMIGADELRARGWSDHAMSELLGPKHWPPEYSGTYQLARPEKFWLRTHVAYVESRADFQRRFASVGRVGGAGEI